MKAKPYERQGRKGVTIHCPGCGIPHNCGQHTFNGDFEKPTLAPSLLQEFSTGEICHSFVRDGSIEFLSDTTKHALRGFHMLPDIKEQP